MSRACDVVILPTSVVAWPSGGRPGDVLVGRGGAIAGAVAVVSSTGAAVPVPTGSSFVPTNDNLTDLGDSTHRFRTIYLGTSITNTGDLAVELTGGARRTLTVRNATAGQVADVVVDGVIGWQDGGAAEHYLGGVATADRLHAFQDADGTVTQVTGAALGAIADDANDLGASGVRWRRAYLSQGVANAGDLDVDLSGGATRTLTLRNSTAGQVARLVVDGSVGVQGGTAFTASLTAAPSADRTLTLQDADGTVAQFAGGVLNALGDNANDLGTSAAAFRSLHLKTSVVSDGILSVQLPAAGAEGLLFVENPNPGLVADVQVTGRFFFRAGTAFTMAFGGAPTANRVLTLPDATDTVAVLGAPQTFQRKTWAPLSVAAINALAAPSEGEVAYASDGRKPGEGPGLGTGVPAFYDGAAWFSMCDGAALVA